ncbi:putative peptide transporter permease subunit: membrane component of ABC superfamily [Acetoanaerobium sticklandii]|jgi:peptide/nickel transport system permease protein|uniref:Putative peptide transporter permease subunit: membrane component of ABC superfamily n=1 Tax=Acetoanaerobium sticklandii (strain ATCC 12662 / DSM 519 / JCM 1433 / CCUG 9281 / NCIMB 10654 / HF) TaxID=499177 RepID=E3PR79_ACESD|nr:ABC transporter permease [Acetoanaerobium sticklandii]CBH20214.1 putative peptide transporter permease subunit: membrane component of ABC superfamily [Acetoanaerobium sticklandii]
MILDKIKLENTQMKLGIILILLPILLALAGPYFTQNDTTSVSPANRLESPHLQNFMGTDNLGRDIFARTCSGIKISLFIGFSVTLVSLIIGVFIGTISAYYPITEKFLMRVVDAIMAFPTIILAIALAGILGAGVKNIIIALSISYFPMIARIAYNSVKQVKETEYVESTIAIGKGDLYIITHCILPNIISPIIVQTTYIFAMAILNESILSFLGVGIQAPMPSLGGMVNDGRNYFMTAPWIMTFPGLTISLIVFSLNTFGDGLRIYYDPRERN